MQKIHEIVFSTNFYGLDLYKKTTKITFDGFCYFKRIEPLKTFVYPLWLLC